VEALASPGPDGPTAARPSGSESGACDDKNPSGPVLTVFTAFTEWSAKAAE
jgi:hypothetical protein